jgi:hypothetical protein
MRAPDSPRSPRQADESALSFNCPLARQSRRTLALADDLAQAVRRLRQAQRTCHDCPRPQGCRLMQTYQAHLQAAIQQVWEEWDSARS